MATEEKNKVGRPRLIASPEEFDNRVDEYLSWCRAKDEPILLTGLVLALGFSSKDTLYQYEKLDEFSDSVKRARTFIEMEYEKRLNTANSATGPIFALKNFGWKDKQEHELIGTLETKLPSLSDLFKNDE